MNKDQDENLTTNTTLPKISCDSNEKKKKSIYDNGFGKNEVNYLYTFNDGEMLNSNVLNANEIYNCQECGSKQISFSTIAWFNLITHAFVEFAQYDKEMHIIACYCDSCSSYQDLSTMFEKYRGNSLQQLISGLDLTARNNRRQNCKCKNAKRKDIIYSSIAWFDLDTREFIELYSEPISIHFNGCECI